LTGLPLNAGTDRNDQDVPTGIELLLWTRRALVSVVGLWCQLYLNPFDLHKTASACLPHLLEPPVADMLPATRPSDCKSGRRSCQSDRTNRWPNWH